MTYSESLKLPLQQLGAYMHSNCMLPQRWQGISPLHLIFRRLHWLLQQNIVSIVYSSVDV